MRRLGFLVILLGLAGCNTIPTLQVTRPATTYDIERSEARVREDINAWNARHKEQWGKIGEVDDSVARLDVRVASLERDNWWMLGVGGAAGIGGGAVARLIPRRRNDKRVS